MASSNAPNDVSPCSPKTKASISFTGTFNFSDKSIISDIGKRNSDAVKKTLKENGIPIIAEEIGGDKGRTMILNASDGKVTLKVVGKGVIEL